MLQLHSFSARCNRWRCFGIGIVGVVIVVVVDFAKDLLYCRRHRHKPTDRYAIKTQVYHFDGAVIMPRCTEYRAPNDSTKCDANFPSHTPTACNSRAYAVIFFGSIISAADLSRLRCARRHNAIRERQAHKNMCTNLCEYMCAAAVCIVFCLLKISPDMFTSSQR